VHWLARTQPPRALDAINRTMARMRHGTVAALPSIADTAASRSVANIFSPGLAKTTAIVTSAYFFHITTFYFIVKWVPKIVVDMGFEAASAAGVLVWVNVGGATGGAVVGLLTQRYGVKGITIGVMVMSTVMVTLFGRTDPDLAQLSLICAASGFFTNGAITGMYAIFAKAFPTHARAFGTGIAIGVGRGGSLLAPIVAGYLFTWNLGLPAVSFMMALGSLCAAGVLLMLKLTPDKPIAEGTPREEIPGDLKGAAAHSR